jgi:hypothetical protein
MNDIDINRHVDPILTAICICVMLALSAAVMMQGCQQCEMTNRARIQAQQRDLELGHYTTTVTITTNIEPTRY